METVTAARARRIILSGVLAAAFGAAAAGVASAATHSAPRGATSAVSPVTSPSARQVVSDQGREAVESDVD